MSEFAHGDPHMNKIYFGKIRDNNILRTDDIEGASVKKGVYDKRVLRDKYFSRQNVSHSVDLKRDAEKAYVNPITHKVFHDYQGKRANPANMVTNSKVHESALRYSMPMNGARIRNPLFSDYKYNQEASYPSTNEMNMGRPVTDSLDSFQKEYNSKKGYGGQPYQYQYQQPSYAGQTKQQHGGQHKQYNAQQQQQYQQSQAYQQHSDQQPQQYQQYDRYQEEMSNQQQYQQNPQYSNQQPQQYQQSQSYQQYSNQQPPQYQQYDRYQEEMSNQQQYQQNKQNNNQQPQQYQQYDRYQEEIDNQPDQYALQENYPYQDNYASKYQGNQKRESKVEDNINNYYGVEPTSKKSLDYSNYQQGAAVSQPNLSNPYGKNHEQGNNFQKNYENFFDGYTQPQQEKQQKTPFGNLNNPKNPLAKKEIYTFDPIKAGPSLKYQKDASSIVNKANDPINQSVKEKWEFNLNTAKFFDG